MLHPLANDVSLRGLLAERRNLDRQYLLSLTDENLLRPYYMEAGLLRMMYMPSDMHGGWESPYSHIKGTVCGHWLSAAAHIVAETGDPLLKVRGDFIVREIGRCQQEHGNGWCFPIPELYLHWLKRGKHTWAPQYVCHKVMMGLLDMAVLTKNAEALEILEKAADWFLRFTEDITPDHMAEMMTEETGGMMELFADLYAVTGKEEHRVLMERYARRDLLQALEAGEDPLTNQHANTTIPEIHGAARAYEVTGDERYRKLVERYWEIAVEKDGMFSTGGHTSGEIWTPEGRQDSRLGNMNQEHCTVYNMMRLADYLFRWTGESRYADYWERNFYNGILAQGFRPENRWEGAGGDSLRKTEGIVAYYLPLEAGAHKHWGSATGDFWCCHCTLLQANAKLYRSLYALEEDRLVVNQYFDTDFAFSIHDVPVKASQSTGLEETRLQAARPQEWKSTLRLQCERPARFTLAFRLPWWLAGKATVLVDGQPADYETDGKGYACLTREWDKQEVAIRLPKAVTLWSLADRADTAAFLDGPVALAGLTDRETTLYYEEDPAEILIPHDERHWAAWGGDWKTVGQPVNLVFKPLYAIGNETYTVYFPLKKQKS